jgi:hypothetical protein
MESIHYSNVRGTPHRSRFNWKSLPAILALFCMLLGSQLEAHAFGAEDLLMGPFHHEEITEAAAMDLKWEHVAKSAETRGKNPTLKDQPKEDEFDAAEVLAWHADYIDSYLYNPLWWARSIPKTGLRRVKAALASQKHLEAVHFDDLFDSDKVRHAWRQYTSGAWAGLMWAKQNKDVAAAQNIVGISLHAMQDFYTHSNWINDPKRRDKTYFNIPVSERSRLHLFTGAYEHAAHLGVKHHGKFLFACSAFNQPGVKEVMKTACGPMGILGDQDICKTFDSCDSGVPVQPKIGGVTAPSGLLFMEPGMAIDNSWGAPLGVKERGLTDLTAEQALKTTLTLAEEQSRQWLKVLGEKMKKVGAEQFWNDVMTQAPDPETRYLQFEDYTKFPYQFLSAGNYPPPSAHNRDEYFLRVKIKTGNDKNAGTDADVKATWGDDTAYTLLDYSPKRNPITGHNDHERGAKPCTRWDRSPHCPPR